MDAGDARLIGKMEGDLVSIHKDLTDLSIEVKAIRFEAKQSCEKCLAKRIVYGVVSVIGLAVITALVALVIKR
jgi:hypothetical protein